MVRMIPSVLKGRLMAKVRVFEIVSWYLDLSVDHANFLQV